MFNQTQIDFLNGPLDSSKVKSRNQGGANLSYIEGWHAIAEANRIFGFDSWQRETTWCQCVEESDFTTRNSKEMKRVGYVARVRITVNTLEGMAIIREGTGFGSGMGYSLGEAHEGAIKEAETDAMKRAFMTFGNPFGLALYDKNQTNVVDVSAQNEAAERSVETIERIALLTTLDDLEGYYKTNSKFIKSLPKELSADVLAAFSKRKVELVNDAEAA